MRKQGHIMTDKMFQIGPPETRTTLPAYHWYKEKLMTKCLKDAKNKHHLSGALDGRRWRFLNVGLDDFRDGYPSAGTAALSQAQRGMSPSIFGMPSPTSLSDKTQWKRFSKEQACFSKKNPQQQVHREHVATVEHKLKQHPLALYPHLEHGMPPELFDQVICVLDPDMCVNRASAVTSPEKEEQADDCTEPWETIMRESESEEEVRERPPVSAIMTDDLCAKNPYKGLQRKQSSAKEDQIVNVKRLRSPSQDEDIKKVTKLFCDWVASLGGEKNNLTESTLLGLFVSGYEKKPSLTFPIQVVEPKNVPEDLRNSVEDLRRAPTCEDPLKDSEPYKSKPGTKRPKYGAWYLDTKTWKKRDADEPLRDPNVIPEDFEFPAQPSEMDDELKQMHGTQAFKQFIISKGLRVPRFLSTLFEEEEGDNRSKPDGAGSASTRKGTVVL
ncbi:protein FAM47A isoform X1 [Oncorhynchus nerka]|uniref:protein FAM47A isoform X1 n=1 Tax=Oncorhynchus nerka TaxID=8023 RepID=UPI0031B8041D